MLEALQVLGGKTGSDRARVAELSRAGVFDALTSRRRPLVSEMPALMDWAQQEGLA